MLIAPSIICANFSRLGEEIEKLDEAGADVIHWDVMDGQFVPNLTLGSQIMEQVRDRTDIPFETHLMVLEPDRHVEPFVISGSSKIIVHPEATTHLVRTLMLIKSFESETGMAQAGVALNPATPPSVLDSILEFVDQVTIMTVNPGWAGQKFLEPMMRKIEQVRLMIDARGTQTQIEVDGGVSPDNLPAIEAAGADIVVGGGSSVFVNGHSYREAIAGLRSVL